MANFFRNHIAGMIIFAIAMGVVASYTYDNYFKDKGKEIQPATQTISSNNNNITNNNEINISNTENNLNQSIISNLENNHQTTSHPDESASKETKLSYSALLDAARLERNRLDDEAEIVHKREIANIEDARATSMTEARAEQSKAMSKTGGDINLVDAARDAFNRKMREISIKYDEDISKSEYNYKQIILKNKNAYNELVNEIEAKKRSGLIFSG